jgi:hypothetical protein
MDPRTERIALRCTYSQKERLTADAKAAGVTLSELILARALGAMSGTSNASAAAMQTAPGDGLNTEGSKPAAPDPTSPRTSGPRNETPLPKVARRHWA